ncbi:MULTISPECIES: DoxX family protein [unclassified Streptomyces]|uniref:DoxX family protein n=1 Tax=unclassified Streptomyces TaxID=2593676 RepID=UPI0033E98ECC
MNILGRLGGALLGGSFAVFGSGAVREPAGLAKLAGPALEEIRKVVPLPKDDELLVRVNGAVQTGAGAALAIGLFPRISALALAGSLIPTTYAGHAFWTVEDPAQRKAQRTQFLKNAVMLGGLLVVAGTPRKTDTPSGTGISAG